MNIKTMIITVFASLIVLLIVTGALIPYLRKKQFGQFIREEGPEAHKSKAGTPSLGGIAIVLGIVTGFCVGDGSIADKIAIILTMLAFGIIGFLDDFAKVAKKNNLGLTAKQKIVLQVLFSIFIGVYMMITKDTLVYIPFVKGYVHFGVFYIPFVIFVEVAMSNAVNLTDGLDGLAGSTTAIVGLVFAALGILTKQSLMVTAGLAIAGSLLGFLWFNKYPAKIFMGDTGSMALGGVLSAIAIVTKTEFLLPIAGLIYVIEALSVIIQVVYFKSTGGKRFFRMAPIHHHFELGGMKEYNVVKMFCLFTAACGIIGLLAYI